ncbi:hypothetical protein KSF_038790 [Reticulibacter mediterranei]|uniref:Uncharacterized protein n=1 Tax=Reticulibacter mediterranei TaxID=2778369 RepID=A0A8J3IR18_9CHLR|nr:hypothetical protein [Reticulibacter mediterranei]GHO93831.1 hypothetical protein KSF_038790 [Reticulibacter mediterranei]
MASLDLTFINAGDNAELDAELEDTLTSDQVIQALINEQFLTPLTDPTRSYMLTIKGRNTIAEGQTLGDARVQQKDRIRVSITQRGGTQ